MDLRGETKAPRIARKDGCWKDVAWIGKRSSLFRHQRRIPPRRLAQKEHPLPHSLPSLSPFLRKQLNWKESANYDLSPCFWTICFLVCDVSVISSRPPYCSLTIVFVSTRIKLYLKFNSVSNSKVSKKFLFRFCLWNKDKQTLLKLCAPSGIRSASGVWRGSAGRWEKDPSKRGCWKEGDEGGGCGDVMYGAADCCCWRCTRRRGRS